MDIFNKLFNKNKIIMYSDSLWTDCQKAKSFFAERNIDIIVKDIADPKIRDEMNKKYNRIMTPTIIIKGETIVGFEQNVDKIKKLLYWDFIFF